MEENIKTITIDAENGIEILNTLTNALEGLKDCLINNEKLSERTRREIKLLDVGSSVYAHLHPGTSKFPNMLNILNEEELEKLSQILTELNEFLEAKYDQLSNTDEEEIKVDKEDAEAYKEAMGQLEKGTKDAIADALKKAEDLMIKEEAAEAENGENK